MRVPNLAKWSNPEGSLGLLIFAQALEEALFDYSPDSFRTPALNLHTSVLEVRSLLLQAQAEDRIPMGLRAAIEELRQLMRGDPVSPKPLPQEWELCYQVLGDPKAKPAKMLPHANALLIEVGRNYWDNLKDQIVVAVSDSKRKERVTRLARAFASEVELRGFSRRYAYFENSGYFFSQTLAPEEIRSAKDVVGFLERFERSATSRNVVFRGTAAFESFEDLARGFGISVSRSFESLSDQWSEKVTDFLGESAERPMYVRVSNLPAKDEHRARELAQQLVDFFTDMCRFTSHTADLALSRDAVVLDEDLQRAGLVRPPTNPMLCHFGGDDRRSAGLSARGVEILAGAHAARDLRQSFLRLLEYHETALSAKTPEGQLLSLWAALEGFLPRPSPRTPKIEFILGSLLPSLTLVHVGSLLRYLASALNAVPEASRLVERSTIGETRAEKLAALLTCEEMEQFRVELGGHLDAHPLLRYRCFRFGKRFSDSSSILSTLTRHWQRCSWHIRRIYSTRNQIAHAAQSLPYLPALVQSLHTYVDVLAETMITASTLYDAPTGIAGALTLLRVHANSRLQLLRAAKTGCSADTYRDLLGLSSPFAG